jgi:hypothetical protein
MIYDVVDAIVQQLNTISGLSFVRDAWNNKAPDNYGVVELTGQVGGIWADGHLIDQSFAVTVSLYVRDGSDTWVEMVQDVLDEYEDEYEYVYSMPQREYLQDVNYVRWSWNLQLDGPLIREDGD